MRTHSLYSLLFCLALIVGCRDDGDRGRPTQLGPLETRIVSRFALHAIALDTLSDSAQILSLLPDPDGGTVAFTFADPTQRISHGLAVLAHSRDSIPRLAWPDSVSTIHWRQAHELVFTSGTGNGVYVILNARADSLVAIRDTIGPFSPDSSTPPTREPTPEIRARITRYIDSLRFQPEGVPQQGQLRYQARRILPAPRDPTVAFHVAATDGRGSTSNPTWYLLDLTNGTVTTVDSVIGPTRMLPDQTGAWANDSTFYFTKDLTLYELRVRRGGSRD